MFGLNLVVLQVFGNREFNKHSRTQSQACMCECVHVCMCVVCCVLSVVCQCVFGPIWVWLKIKQEGLRRCWSMFPLTRVPCWVPIFEPTASLYYSDPCRFQPSTSVRALLARSRVESSKAYERKRCGDRTLSKGTAVFPSLEVGSL